MATVQTLILDPALRKLGISSPEATDRNNALAALNRMLSSWGADDYLIYSITRENFTLTIDDAEYTIGSSGDFNTVRPVKITDAFLRDSTTDYPLDIRTLKHYNEITEKATDGRPTNLYYLTEYPLAKILFDYEPDKAYVLYLNSLKRITAFAAKSTAVSLPEEYERALIFNLVVELASEYDEQLSREVFVIASETKDSIKNLNASNRLPEPMKADPAITYNLSR